MNIITSHHITSDSYSYSYSYIWLSIWDIMTILCTSYSYITSLQSWLRRWLFDRKKREGDHACSLFWFTSSCINGIAPKYGVSDELILVVPRRTNNTYLGFVPVTLPRHSVVCTVQCLEWVCIFAEIRYLLCKCIYRYLFTPHWREGSTWTWKVMNQLMIPYYE